MPAFALRFVGQESLPSRLSEFDREQFFELSLPDIDAIRDQFRGAHRLSTALMVMFMRVAGRPLNGFDVLPRSLLRYTAQAFGVYAPSIASLRSASLALERFGTAAQGDPLHRAAEHLGRLLRTVFLCDYIAIEDFRREIHMLLNRGESVHQLQRAVFSGKVAPDRGRRRDEMRAISGSHALLTNIVLAWNTRRMHETVERLRRGGTTIEDEWLRRIGPAHFGHINFRGTMKFSVEKYADALVQRGSRASAVAH
jgi:hypothetical protein